MTVEAPLTLRKRIARGAFAGMNRPDCCVPGCDLDGPAPKRPDCNCYMEAEMIADAIIAAIGEEWRVPDGWQLVPVEPTREMLGASTVLVPTWDDDASRRKWAAMLEAAPSPSPPPLGEGR